MTDLVKDAKKAAQDAEAKIPTDIDHVKFRANDACESPTPASNDSR